MHFAGLGGGVSSGLALHWFLVLGGGRRDDGSRARHNPLYARMIRLTVGLEHAVSLGGGVFSHGWIPRGRLICPRR